MKYEVFVNGNGIIVKEKGHTYTIDLRKRLIRFSVNVIRFLMKLPNNKEYDVLRYQLSRSATAVGANYEEAQSASRKEFVQKVRIALREANESKYWLNIVNELQIGDAVQRNHLLQEAQEISLILGAIVSRMVKKQNNP